MRPSEVFEQKRTFVREAVMRYRTTNPRIFGSVLSTTFDADKSDVDFLVDFLPGRGGLFHDYFELKEDLERIVGRGVDLVDAGAVRNPYFARSAFGSAEDLYAA